jgi:hypothetical protein
MIGYDRVNTPCDKPCLFCPVRAEQWFSNLLRRRTLPRLWKGGDLHGQTTDDQSSFQPFGQSEGAETGSREATRPALLRKLANSFKSGIRRDDVVLSFCINYVIVNPLTLPTCLWYKAILQMKGTPLLHSTMLSTWLPYLQQKGTGSSPPRPPPFLKLLLTYLHR